MSPPSWLRYFSDLYNLFCLQIQIGSGMYLERLIPGSYPFIIFVLAEVQIGGIGNRLIGNG